MNPPSPGVLAVVDDLFFAAKIGETAKLAGVDIQFATTEAAILDQASRQPSLIVLDLNLKKLPPLPLIAKLKSQPGLEKATLLGFVSHVQGELIGQARAAGCDLVLARSEFAQRLAEILKQYSGLGQGAAEPAR